MHKGLWVLGIGAALAAWLGTAGTMPDVSWLAGKAMAASGEFGEAAAVGPAVPGAGYHYPSLGLGILIGIILSALARISWLELPRRFVRWLLRNERNFYRLGMAAVCLAVLLYY